MAVFGPAVPAMVAPGCATANSLPLSVTRPFAVAVLVELTAAAIANGTPTATPAVAMTTCSLIVSPGCSVGDTVLPGVTGLVALAVTNAMDWIVPAPETSPVMTYASATLPVLVIVNVRVTGVPTG